MNYVSGGVCAAKGFTANGIHCGVRKNKTKKDLALIFSCERAVAAGVYTTNLVKGAPLLVTKRNISDGYAQAMVCNSGNANTCNANGIEMAEAMTNSVAKELNISADDIIVASTGVIGQEFPIKPILEGIPALAAGLGDKSSYAAHAIMTTDTQKKEIAVKFTIGNKDCILGGISKGSGMIHPNMATMLTFMTSDVNITNKMLQKALSDVVKDTFNMISVDGDTSTNDMVTIMANGMAENEIIDKEDDKFETFKQALMMVSVALAKRIAADGEGATKLLECKVNNAKDDNTARTVAKSVICSSLFKAAMFGADANWGRVICAIGYSGADVDINSIDISFKSKDKKILVCENGRGLDFSEELAKEILLEPEIEVLIDLKAGKASATAYGCDLTYDYVKINGDYRT